MIFTGDCLEVMTYMDADSVDAIVTDPPYGLSFMDKDWDHGIPGEHFWREALRVAKPGAYLLAFGGTRTFHRIACAIEDAGWEIRDTIMWVYGSGFPKSKNLDGEWQGWGTALKPAYEPIIVARKPLIGTVAENVQAHGTGAMNIDGCRVSTEGEVIHTPQSDPSKREGVVGTDLGISDSSAADFQAAQRASIERANTMGRWPANLIHDGSDDVLAGFPDSKGQQGDVKGTESSRTGDGNTNCYGLFDRVPAPKRNDSGSAARFFYCAKASKSDRGEDNNHPTVKPNELMRYLCRMVTPPGGLILDPFMGSGSTGKAAIQEGFLFVGIEQSADYVEIATSRIKAAL
jgi:site-specific DNA-methyltransferase (adenine-specific)